jgi:hypothetical protein
MPMSILPNRKLRTAALAAAAVSAMLLAALPASADHGRRWRGHHRGPRVAVIVGLPPIVLAGDPYYDDYPRRGRRGYERGYEDGYDDRAREEWRRRRHRHHHHDDCDDWY